MRGAVLYGPHDIRVDNRPDPRIVEPTDAIIRLSATCVCGSDLWPYRGLEPVDGPAPMGHEYVGIVEEVGSAVTSIEPGQFVIGSFFASDNTCEVCRAGYQSSCIHRELGVDPRLRALLPLRTHRLAPPHPRPDPLYVTEGEGYVQARGGPLVRIRPGDVIRIVPEEEHWHGATPTNFMTHLALTEGDTQWGNHLTDTEYPSDQHAAVPDR
jgi:Alcohol dehydrogenase GroES-like domain